MRLDKQNGQGAVTGGDPSLQQLREPPPLPVAQDPAYELSRIGFTRELDLGNGITDAIQHGNIYDIRKTGTTFEVRQKGRDAVYEIYPAQVGSVVWLPKPKPPAAEEPKA